VSDVPPDHRVNLSHEHGKVVSVIETEIEKKKKTTRTMANNQTEMSFELINRISHYKGKSFMSSHPFTNYSRKKREREKEKLTRKMRMGTGRQAINRLRFLAQASPSLSLAAYELALQTITQSTWDIPLYKETLTAYNKIATANDLPPLAANQEWLDNTQTETSLSLARLENDLKHNTTNLIKDGIRVGVFLF
jgi:hypothetical protein